MSTFTKDLLPGEKVLAVSRKNWTFFLNLRVIIAIAIALIFLSFLPLISVIALVVALVPTVLQYLNTELVLTTVRLRGKQGVFHIRTVENKASYFVGNFKTDSNVIMHSLGSDTIIIESAGVGRFIFSHMKDAQQMSNALYSLGNKNALHLVEKM